MATKREIGILEELEAQVDNSQVAFVRTGRALKMILENEYWKLRNEYGAFVFYVKARFDISKSYAYRLIHAYETWQAIKNSGRFEIVPQNEGQCRQLLDIPEIDRRVDCWELVIAESEAEEKPISAAMVRRVVDNFLGREQENPAPVFGSPDFERQWEEFYKKIENEIKNGDTPPEALKQKIRDLRNLVSSAAKKETETETEKALGYPEKKSELSLIRGGKNSGYSHGFEGDCEDDDDETETAIQSAALHKPNSAHHQSGTDGATSSPKPAVPDTPQKTEKPWTENDIPYQLAQHLYSQIHTNDPAAKKPNFQSWATHLDRLIRLDKRDPDEIGQVIDWCQSHPFWLSNILSARKLRIQYPKLRLQWLKTQKKQGKNSGSQRPKTDWERQLDAL